MCNGGQKTEHENQIDTSQKVVDIVDHRTEERVLFDVPEKVLVDTFASLSGLFELTINLDKEFGSDFGKKIELEKGPRNDHRSVEVDVQKVEVVVPDRRVAAVPFGIRPHYKD